ncbi:unnamed protein product [Durusdinium trenchii]|uniref:Uncharacterized protein n=1 Tax=Durusdinium trenchii TaxID=1381693 RepID=A0ABP0J7P3_9DINO
MGGRKGVAKSKAAPKVKSLPDAPMASTDCINAEVMARLAVHDAHIKDAFDDLLTTSPTNESGFPAYKEIDAVAALTAHRPYVCACPLYWLNLAFEFQPNLPKYQKRLDNLEAHFFEEPKNLTEPIVVYLNPGELPHKMVGSLRAFDASEMRDALRQAVTSLMRIYEIMDFKKQLELTTDVKQNKTSLHAHYKGVKMAQSSEEVSIAFIEVANMLYHNMLNSPRIQQLCFQLDQNAVNPLDSIHKLREIAVQCEKKEPLMYWTLSMISDWWCQTDGTDPVPIRSLRETSSMESVSLIRMMLFKRQMKEKMLRMMDTDFPLWDAAVKSDIRAAVETVQSCRSKLGVYDANQESGDAGKVPEPLTERGSWPESADRFLLAFEALIYGYSLDEIITSQMKQRRSVEDVLDQKAIKPFIEKPKQLYEKETKPPGEVEEEAAKGDDAENPEVVAEELAVTTNQSQAESLLKQISGGGMDASEELVTTLKAGLRVAERRVSSHITLVVDWNTDDKDDLESQIKALNAVKVRGDEEEAKSYVAIVFDSKTVCESGSQAKYRLPPTRAGQIQRLLNAVLSTRADGDLAEGDVLIAIDGGREQDWAAKNIIKFLPSKKYETCKHTICYTFDSVEKRMERASKSPLSLFESAWFISHNELSIKVQPRLVTSGNTRGNVLGPFTKPSWVDGTETWLLPATVKRAVFGKDNLPLPGGACPVEHEKEAAPKSAELVPVFFHDSPQSVSAELLHYVQGRAVIDMTPGTGHWALQCIRKRVPYCGFCLSEKHRELLQKKLISRTLAAMSDPADETLYDAGFAKAVKDLTEQNKKPGDEDMEAEGKKNRKNKDKNAQGGGPEKKAKTEPKPPAEPKGGPKPKPTPKPMPAAGGDDDAAREALLKRISEAASAASSGEAPVEE